MFLIFGTGPLAFVFAWYGAIFAGYCIQHNGTEQRLHYVITGVLTTAGQPWNTVIITSVASYARHPKNSFAQSFGRIFNTLRRFWSMIAPSKNIESCHSGPSVGTITLLCIEEVSQRNSDTEITLKKHRPEHILLANSRDHSQIHMLRQQYFAHNKTPPSI